MQPQADTKTRFWPLPWPSAGFPLIAFLFFLLFFVYVWLRIDPGLEYGYSNTTFFLSRAFSSRFLARPGGLADYAAVFLAQLNYYSWLGALVFTALGLLLFVAARCVCAPVGGGRLPAAGLGLPFLLLLLRGRYDGQALGASLGLLLGLSAAAAYLVCPCRCWWWRLAAAWLLATLTAGLAGLWPCLLFLVVCGWVEVARHGRYLWSLGFLALALALSFTIIGLADLPPARILNPWGTGLPFFLIAALFLFVPALMLILALLPDHAAPGPAASSAAQPAPPSLARLAPAPKPSAGHARRDRSKEDGRRPRHAVGAALPSRRRRLRVAVQRALFAGMFLAGGVAVWFVFDDAQKTRARIESYAAHNDYEKLLAVAARAKVLTPAAQVRLHLALYHTGRLTQDLFTFTNQTTWSLLPGVRAGWSATRAQAQTLFELGQVNEAEHLAHESLETEGDRPDLLRLLAQINLLKDRSAAARVFLNLLEKVPFHRAWAQARLRELEGNLPPADNQELALIRSRMPTTDFPHDGMPAETLLVQLLRSNPRNQMAFEYLMAHYLLTRDPGQLVKHLGRLDDFGYPAIPRHLEEALLLHQQLKGASVDLHGRQVRPETVARFQLFSAALKRRAYESQAGRQALARDFGDTFWYHYYTKPAAAR